MELNRAVAENIKRIRKSKKLSMERTAAIAGVSRSMLGQIERGEANPSVAIIGKLAAALKVPAEVLLEKAAAFRDTKPAQVIAQHNGVYIVTGEGDPAIDALVLQRYEAKKAKNFAEADRIRDELKAQGIEIIDTKGGASWKRV